MSICNVLTVRLWCRDPSQGYAQFMRQLTAAACARVAQASPARLRLLFPFLLWALRQHEHVRLLRGLELQSPFCNITIQYTSPQYSLNYWMTLQGTVSSTDWVVLLQEQPPAATGLPAGDAAARPEWLPLPRWRAVCSAAAAVLALAALPDSLLEQPDVWRAIYEAAKPQGIALPGVWCLLSDVERLIVLRALRRVAFIADPDSTGVHAHRICDCSTPM